MKDRFQNKSVVDGPKTMVERHLMTLEPGKSSEKMWAAFDENDADYGEIALQVEVALNRSVDTAALAKENRWATQMRRTPVFPNWPRRTPGLYPSKLT